MCLTIYKQLVKDKNVACTALGMQIYMAKFAVKMDKKSPVNILDQHTRTLGFSFMKRVTPLNLKDVL